MSVQRSASSVKRGQAAAYLVQVSTDNGPAAGVTVTLTAQPASQQPAFTSGCAEGNATASCTIGSMSAQQSVALRAQIPVASGATAVKSVTLTATASVATTAQWTPPAAAQTVAVTAPATAGPAKAAPAGPATQLATLPLGPIPDLNGIASAIIGAGNASGLFPRITPSATPRPSPAAHPEPRRENAGPAAGSAAFALGMPVLTAQVIGLIALAFGIMLTVTRPFPRRRTGPKGGGR